jgi:hypothetical protein
MGQEVEQLRALLDNLTKQIGFVLKVVIDQRGLADPRCCCNFFVRGVLKAFGRKDVERSIDDLLALALKFLIVALWWHAPSLLN